jgi:tryptophan synthase beta subunit
MLMMLMMLTNAEITYIPGSSAGPPPYPMMVGTTYVGD